MSQMTVDQALQIAIQHQQAGQLGEAENIYRQILGAFPEQPDALHLLGSIAYQAGMYAEAEKCVRQAIAARDEPNFSVTLGLILAGMGRSTEALEVYDALLARAPETPEVHVNRGVVLATLNRHAEAVNAFQHALRIAPGNATVEMNLGISLCRVNRSDEAIWVLRDAVRRKPRDANIHAALGAALYTSKQLEAAVASCREALAIDPNLAMAYQNLSLVLRDLGRDEDSAEAARRAAELLPDFIEPQITYGEACRLLGKFDECRATYERALLRHPHDSGIYNNLGNLYADAAQIDLSLDTYRKGIAICPDSTALHSNLLYTLQFHAGSTTEEVYAAHRQFNETLCEPLRRAAPPHDNDPSPERRLRVAYFSPDFREHALGFYMLPLLTNHDKSQFEVFVYSAVQMPDFVTFRIRQVADHWMEYREWPDEQLAERLRADKIDILVDVHLHMNGARPLVFARRPAPVQIAFAGYPGTSGITAIDYRLTDPYLEPERGPRVPSAEKLLRMQTFWCYYPQVTDIPVAPPPAAKNGYVTFGNLNNFKKFNEGTFALWARVLAAVPQSRLVMLAAQGIHRQWATDIFARHGIAAERITFVPRQRQRSYMETYHTIDIGLDSFPYNGHTTSLDSFYMGVPVVTLIGQTPVSRAGYSQLRNLELPELAVPDHEDFIAVAAGLANDLPRLATLRAGLRERLTRSPLMDGPRFAREVEAAYRLAWRNWCATHPRPFNEWVR